jgi:hypothetical protein
MLARHPFGNLLMETGELLYVASVNVATIPSLGFGGFYLVVVTS